MAGIGFCLNLVLATGKFTPTAFRSTANDLTLASGGTSITIPWVTNNMESTPATAAANLKVAIQAGVAAILNAYAINGAPA